MFSNFRKISAGLADHYLSLKFILTLEAAKVVII